MSLYEPRHTSCSETPRLLHPGGAAAAVLAAALLLRCGVGEPATHDPVRFGVFDVGQGLAQMAERGGRAVAWDMGDTTGYAGWAKGYRELGAPSIGLIAVSHLHADHYGGLSRLAPGTDFSGIVATSPYADTGLLRARAGHWRERLTFRTVSRGDTLGCLEGVWIECLWPPDRAEPGAEGLSSADENRVSLCFLIRFEHTSLLITSDIDTLVCRELAATHAGQLRAEAVVVPHHGSRYSLDGGFYGYVDPETAIVSCGRNNTHDHPAPEVIRFLAFQSGVRLFRTDRQGAVEGRSNGEYWSWTAERPGDGTD